MIFTGLISVAILAADCHLWRGSRFGVQTICSGITEFPLIRQAVNSVSFPIIKIPRLWKRRCEVGHTLGREMSTACLATGKAKGRRKARGLCGSQSTCEAITPTRNQRQRVTTQRIAPVPAA
jgi:hypothetical protein